MTKEQFDRIATDVWAQLLPLIPGDLRDHFHKVRILIEDDPPPEVLAEIQGTELEHEPENLCGLHIGVPLPETSIVEPPVFPARVYLFRWALLDQSDYDGSPEAMEDLREEIAITLLHEIGHFFGLDEDDLDRLGFA